MPRIHKKPHPHSRFFYIQKNNSLLKISRLNTSTRIHFLAVRCRSSSSICSSCSGVISSRFSRAANKPTI